MGSAGIGSGSHIAGEYFFKVLAKAPVKHIPFPGGNPAMMGLLTGDVTVLAATATALVRNVNNGDVTGLGIAATERSPTLPTVPTFAEAGYPGAVGRIMDRFLRAGRHARSGAGEAQQRDQRDPAGAGDRQAHRGRRPANDDSQPARDREDVPG